MPEKMKTWNLVSTMPQTKILFLFCSGRGWTVFLCTLSWPRCFPYFFQSVKFPFFQSYRPGSPLQMRNIWPTGQWRVKHSITVYHDCLKNLESFESQQSLYRSIKYFWIFKGIQPWKPFWCKATILNITSLHHQLFIYYHSLPCGNPTLSKFIFDTSTWAIIQLMETQLLSVVGLESFP